MGCWAFKGCRVLLGTSWRASCLHWPSWMGDASPMRTLFLSQDDFCATTQDLLGTLSHGQYLGHTLCRRRDGEQINILCYPGNNEWCHPGFDPASCPVHSRSTPSVCR